MLILKLDISDLFFNSREDDKLPLLKYNFDKQEFTQIDNILTIVIKDCKDIFFHAFPYRLEKHKNFENKKSGGRIYFKLFTNCTLLSSQFDRLLKKMKHRRKVDTNSMKDSK